MCRVGLNHWPHALQVNGYLHFCLMHSCRLMNGWFCRLVKISSVFFKDTVSILSMCHLIDVDPAELSACQTLQTNGQTAFQPCIVD